MKNINLDTIGLSWFMSTGDKLVHKFLDKPVFIKGQNDTIGQRGQKNGCGKTVIFLDSILFAFYGKVAREGFKMSDIPYNRGAKKTCVVSLKFDVDTNGNIVKYEIIRTLNPSKLTLLKDGVDISQSSAATQEFIEREILGGINIDVFKNSIAMKLDKSKAFMEMAKPDREKFIGGVFDLTFVKEANKLASAELNTLKKDLIEHNTKVSMLVPRVNTLTEQVDSAEEEFNKQLDEKTKLLDRVGNAITEFVKKTVPDELSVEELTSEIDHKDELISNKIKEIHDQKEVFNKQITEVKSEIREKKNTFDENIRLNERDEKAKVCPSCKREMDENCVEEIKNNIKERLELNVITKDNIQTLVDFIKHVENDKIAELQPQLDKLDRAKDIIRDQRSEVSKKITDNQREIREVNEYMSKLDKLKDKHLMLEEDLGKFAKSNMVDTLTKELIKTKDELEEVRSVITKVEYDVEVLEHVKHIFSENGIRKTILGRLVELFNNNVNNYLQRLEAPCTVVFDDTFNFVLKTLGGVEIPYGSLSGGERLRMTTALAFTFKDILRIQNQISFNISLYDEWFDAAIDERGLEIVGEILKERKDNYGDNPYIITHRTELNIENSEEITVVKDNGISKILTLNV